MSTDLVLTGQRPSYLPAVPAAMSGADNPYLTGLSQGALLPTLAIRGKEFHVRRGDEEVTLGYECSVLLLGSRPNLSKKYYATGYKEGERAVPRCASDDGIHPTSPDGNGVMAPSCVGCPMNVFGTGQDQHGQATKGKACQDFRRLVVYPLVSIGGHPLRQAMVLDIPPTSFRAKKGQPPAYSEFVRTLGEHGALVPAGDRLIGAVVAKLSFMSGVTHSRLVWTAERWASDEEMAAASEIAVDDDVTETLVVGGTPAPAAATPAESYGTGPAMTAVAPPVAQATPAPVAATPAPAPAEQAPLAGAELQELLAKLKALGVNA
jgi:hypothetical protein